MEARGRTLVSHGGGLEEWGVAGSARLSPGPDGRGLSFALSPLRGAAESGLSRLWDEGVTNRASDGDAMGVDAEVGYGFGAWAGVMTPHAGFGYEEDGSRRYRLGTRFAFGPDLAVGLQTERQEGAGDDDHGAGLDLRLRW